MASQESLRELMEAFNKRMEIFEAELHKSPATSSTSSLAADFAAFKTFTTQALRGFQQQMELLAQSVDNIEMHSRRKFLLLHGVPEDKQEDTVALVVRTASTHLKLPNFDSSNINRCQRLGRTGGEKPRPILVKLKDIGMRSKMWSSKTSLKGTNITLSEFLTRPRHQAFMEARQRFGVTNCWTRDGYIHILRPDGKRHRISSLSELQKIDAVSKPSPVIAALKPIGQHASTANKSVVTTRKAAASQK